MSPPPSHPCSVPWKWLAISCIVCAAVPPALRKSDCGGWLRSRHPRAPAVSGVRNCVQRGEMRTRQGRAGRGTRAICIRTVYSMCVLCFMTGTSASAALPDMVTGGGGGRKEVTEEIEEMRQLRLSTIDDDRRVTLITHTSSLRCKFRAHAVLVSHCASDVHCRGHPPPSSAAGWSSAGRAHSGVPGRCVSFQLCCPLRHSPLAAGTLLELCEAPEENAEAAAGAQQRAHRQRSPS